MRMRSKNVARLASLSALGAGALGVTAGTAEAGIIYTPLDVTVGFPGASSLRESFPGGLTFLLDRVRGATHSVPVGWARSYAVMLWGDSTAGRTLNFKTGNAAPGQTWNTFHGLGPMGPALAWRRTTFSVGTYTFHDFVTSGDFYKLFEFRPGTGVYSYGWAEFSDSAGWMTGPTATLLGVAYEDVSGVTIAAGDTGPPPSSAPEPSTMYTTGLAALALGAIGLRRWRASRKLAG